MSNTSQIKTHFDRKIITFFIVIFILSCTLLIAKSRMRAECIVEDFNTDTKIYKEGQLITFSDTTKNSSDWKWDFGDGSTEAFLSKVSHAYEKAGRYNVKLVINENCVVEKTITVLTNKKEVDGTLFPKFIVPKNIVQGVAANFKDISKNAKTWEWRFNDIKGMSIDATSQNPTYVFKNPGNKVVTLVINGDYNHVTKIPIFVSPAKKVEIPKGPVEIDKIKPKCTKIKIKDEADLKRVLAGVSQNVLSFNSLSNYFCKQKMPQVNVNDDKTIELKVFDEQIRDKKIKIRELSFQKDDNGCITFININFKFREY